MDEIRHSQSESPMEMYVYQLYEVYDQKDDLDRATNSAKHESWKSEKARCTQSNECQKKLNLQIQKVKLQHSHKGVTTSHSGYFLLRLIQKF